MEDKSLRQIAAKHAALRPVKLTRDHATQAFALAWLAEPRLTPARWRAVVRSYTGATQRRGLMTIEDGRGHAHALYGYKTDHDLAHTRFLRVLLYAVSTFPGLDVYGVLVNSFQAIAQQCGCARVVIDLSECANEGLLSRTMMADAGFTASGTLLVKSL
ncbi:MAG: hypothetical protein ACRCTD_00655 [Beijerinckiaceae bacterium]